MRTDKFKFIMDAMASHAIEETNSEYSASFISADGRPGHHYNRGNVNPHQKGAGGGGHGTNSTVLEVDEMSESSKGQDGLNKVQQRRYQAEEDSYYDPNEMMQSGFDENGDKESDESFQ